MVEIEDTTAGDVGGGGDDNEGGGFELLTGTSDRVGDAPVTLKSTWDPPLAV